MKKIAVLIPCYNEEQTIKKVINDFKVNLPEAKIYVYDNNSTDNTSVIAKQEGAIVRKELKQGKGNVVKTMFREIDADVYIMVDGDDTYEASFAKEISNKVLEGYDMVIGDRLSSTYFTENKRMFHNSGNRIVRYFINLLFKSDIKDIMTGYRGFSKKFVKNYPITSKGFEIETEMTIHALDKGFNIYSLPITYRDRPIGSVSKLNTVKDGIRVLKTIFNLFKEYKPLAFFGSLSCFLLIVSIILFIPILTEFLKTNLVPRFPTLIVSCVLAIIALLSFVCGIILDSINQKYRQLYELHLLDFASGESTINEK